MTFGHDFFGNTNRVMNAQTILGPGGEEQPTETTLVATQTSPSEEPEEGNLDLSNRNLLVMFVPVIAMFSIITIAGFWNDYQDRKFYGPQYNKRR